MTLDDLSLRYKLVDVDTGEIVGYHLISEVGRVVALTKSKILELGLDLANYIDFVDAPILEVISERNMYAPTENALYFNEGDSDFPYKVVEGNKISLRGHVFNRFHIMYLDNESAIKNVLLGEENDEC